MEPRLARGGETSEAAAAASAAVGHLSYPTAKPPKPVAYFTILLRDFYVVYSQISGVFITAAKAAAGHTAEIGREPQRQTAA